MKKLLILACTLAIGTAAFAAPAKKPVIAHLAGTVDKYDAASRTLAVKHGGKDTTFQLNDQSQVMKGKAKADASALTASTGQSVTVAYVMDGARRVAERIDVATMHAAVAKKK